MIWKSAILLWVAFFLVKYLVRVNVSREEQIKMALGGHLKWTPGRVVLLIVFLRRLSQALQRWYGSYFLCYKL